MKKLSSALFISASLVTAGAFAQGYTVPTEGTQEVTLAGSGSSDKDFDNNFFNIEGSYGRYLSSQSAVGVRQTVSVADPDGQSSEWNGSTRAFYDYHFGQARTRPFLGANLGYVYGDSVKESFLAGLTAGVKHYVLASTFVVGALEYQYFFEDGDEINNRFDDGSFVYSLGLGFNF